MPKPIVFEVLSQEEVDRRANDPREIEYREYQKRVESRIRPHCVGCGRFMRKATLRQHSDHQPDGYCENCGCRQWATWERS